MRDQVRALGEQLVGEKELATKLAKVGAAAPVPNDRLTGVHVVRL